VPHQHAELSQRPQRRALADEQPEMRTVRPVGPERDEPVEVRVGDARAAVEKTGVKLQLGKEVARISSEFDKGGVDRLFDPRTAQRDGKRLPVRAGAARSHGPRCVSRRSCCDRRGHGHPCFTPESVQAVQLT
jgi:hypothetical protein